MRRTWMAAAVVLTALLGCGEVGPGQPGQGGDPPDAFGGDQWLLVAGVPLVDGYPITLQARDGRLEGTAACNSYGATVSIDGDRVDVDDVELTAMGCPQPGVQDSEGAYVAALGAVERATRDDDTLVLTGPGVELIFEAVPAT